MTESYKIKGPYHPNAVDLHLGEAQQKALESLGLADKVAEQGMDALTTEEAVQAAQELANRYDALASNVDLQSE